MCTVVTALRSTKMPARKRPRRCRRQTLCKCTFAFYNGGIEMERKDVLHGEETGNKVDTLIYMCHLYIYISCPTSMSIIFLFCFSRHTTTSFCCLYVVMREFVCLFFGDFFILVRRLEHQIGSRNYQMNKICKSDEKPKNFHPINTWPRCW